MKVKSLSRVRLFETQWTAAYQAPPSMGFSRQEYWSEVPLPSPVDDSRLSQLQWLNLCLCIFIETLYSSYVTNVINIDILNIKYIYGNHM